MDYAEKYRSAFAELRTKDKSMFVLRLKKATGRRTLLALGWQPCPNPDYLQLGTVDTIHYNHIMGCWIFD